MLPSIEEAHNVHGNRKKQIAATCGVTPTTLYKWETGRRRCPKHKRQALQRAYDAAVDWAQYDREVDACQRVSAPQSAGEVISNNLPPVEPKAPPMPPQSVDKAFNDMFGGMLA